MFPRNEKKERKKEGCTMGKRKLIEVEKEDKDCRWEGRKEMRKESTTEKRKEERKGRWRR